MSLAKRFRASALTGGMFALLALGACESRDSPAAIPITPIEVTTLASEPAEVEHRPEFGPAELDGGGIDAIPGDPVMAAEGTRLFETKTCGECHDMARRRRGPPLDERPTGRKTRPTDKTDRETNIRLYPCGSCTSFGRSFLKRYMI